MSLEPTLGRMLSVTVTSVERIVLTKVKVILNLMFMLIQFTVMNYILGTYLPETQ